MPVPLVPRIALPDDPHAKSYYPLQPLSPHFDPRRLHMQIRHANRHRLQRRSQDFRQTEQGRLDIEIWPSATLFEAGSELIVEILGHDADRYPALRHDDTVNAGAHSIHTGPLTPSALVFNALP